MRFGFQLSCLLAAASSVLSLPAANIARAQGTDFLRGVNVGNWLVVEKWMDNGSLFKGAFSGASDQWTFDSVPGSAAAIEKHWESWFTEADVKKIAGYGFNALRIPIGFWAYDNSGTPYQKGADKYLEKAIGWARNAHMKVLVDMHGSPGSQNGQDHSGHAGAVQWQQGDNLQRSTRALVAMAKKYGGKAYADVVFGIETVNEPTANAPNSFATSQQWSEDAFKAMYEVLENKQLQIITHDSFRGPTLFTSIAGRVKANYGMQRSTFGVDQHNYQLYTDADNVLTQTEHIRKACGWGKDLAATRAQMPVYVGEWSSLTNVCVYSDGTSGPTSWTCKGDPGCSCGNTDPSTWKPALVQATRRYVEAQLDTYEANSDGYFLWSYGGPGGWGVQGMVAVGAFPSNVVSDRKYRGQCSS